MNGYMKGKSKMPEYIKREDALRIFRHLEPPKFDLDCWGRLESSAEYDMWKMYYNKLQELPCIKLQELPCIKAPEKDNTNN